MISVENMFIAIGKDYIDDSTHNRFVNHVKGPAARMGLKLNIFLNFVYVITIPLTERLGHSSYTLGIVLRIKNSFF